MKSRQILILLAITTGLRRGEIVGLEWKHIDLETGIIEVKQSISLSENGERIITEPKAKKSKRKISLPDSVQENLKEYYLFSRKKRLTLGDAWKGGEHFFVFPNFEGKAFYPETPYLWFRKFLKRMVSGIFVFMIYVIHLQPYYINKGVHAKIISERLGHASITTTMNVYGHALQSADKEAANKFYSIVPFKQRKTK